MLGLIWAQTPDGVIGSEGAMPWHVPEDLAHFKRVTASHAVVMGRRTWQSLPERFRPLPGRRNIVLTRDSTWADAGAHPAHSLAEALALADTAEVWVMGGGQVYREALDTADVVWRTVVDVQVPGDTSAPALGPEWSRTQRGDWLRSRSGPRYRFERWERAATDQ